MIFLLLGLVTIALSSTVPRPMADFPTDVNSGTALACAEGEKKCMAARDDGRDGAAFICKNGSWDILQDCRSFERCVSNPTPHCTWASPRRRGKTSVAPRVETSEDVVKDSTVKLLESFCQSCAEKLENCSQDCEIDELCTVYCGA